MSATVSEDNGDQYLRVWELDKVLSGDLKPLSRVSLRAVRSRKLRVLPDGRYLYGSSYYTGVSNIFRYEVATGAMEAVSNADSGFFRPRAAHRRTADRADLHRRGLRPGHHRAAPAGGRQCDHLSRRAIAEKFPEVKTWQVPPASTVDDQKLIVAQGPYVPLRTLELENGYPVLQGYKTAAGVGYHVNIEDPLQFASLGVTAAYTPENNLRGDERGHIDVTGRYRFWNAELSWNRSDFYDLFGPTERSRKGYAAKLGYDWLLIYDTPAAAGSQVQSSLLRQDRHAAGRAERSRPTSRDCGPARSGSTTRTCSARWAQSTTRKGSPGRCCTT